MEIYISGWFGFWLFMIFFFVLDTYIFSRGYDSFMQSHKTPEEKELQKYKISIVKDAAEVSKLLIDSRREKLHKGVSHENNNRQR